MNSFNKLSQMALKSFLGLYILIYCLPFPANNIPYAYQFFSRYVYALKAEFTKFIGRKFLGFENLNYLASNGSGDTTVDYLALLSYSILAIVISVPLIFALKNKVDKFYGLVLKMVYTFVFQI